MISAFLALLSAIPGIGSIIQGIEKTFFDAKVRLVQIRTGADVTVATQMVSAAMQKEAANVSRLNIFASNKFLTFLLIAFAVPIVAYEWQVVVYDNIIMNGGHTTPAIKGEVADWMNTIIYFLFGAPTAMGIGKMWFGRNKTGE